MVHIQLRFFRLLIGLVFDYVPGAQPFRRPGLELPLGARRKYSGLQQVAAVKMHVCGGKFRARDIAHPTIGLGEILIGGHIVLVARQGGRQYFFGGFGLAGQQQRLPVADLQQRRLFRVEFQRLLVCGRRLRRLVQLDEDVAAQLPGILTQSTQAGLQITDLAVESPTLQDVFLHYTGHALRET